MKIFIGLGVCATIFFVGASFAFFSSWYTEAETTFVENEKNIIAEQVEEKFAVSARPGDFLLTDKDAQKKIFDAFWIRTQSPDIVRMKVWREDTVLWSDVSEIVGQRFSDNDELQMVQEKKKSVVEIKSPGKAENITEQQYGELLEVYVPIFDEKKDIVGVIEVYSSTADMREFLEQKMIRQILVLGIPILSLYALSIMMLWRFFMKKAQSI